MTIAVAYGIPQNITVKTLSFLEPPLREVYDCWRKEVKDCSVLNA